MRFKSIFVTGTDTGVGKTLVTCGLAAAARRRGLVVGVFKPAETGCPTGSDGGLEPEDAARLRFFSGSRLDRQTICPYALRAPLAPAVAAQREGVRIDPEDLRQRHDAIAAAHDVTFIEGAGGLLVPVTPSQTFADLALQWRAPLLVVVGSRLGAINHALLTVHHARSIGLDVIGYVINFLGAVPDLAAESNVSVLSAWLGPPLGVIPYLGAIECTENGRTHLAERFAAALQLDRVLVPG